jgi:HK97 family phage portal protein
MQLFGLQLSKAVPVVNAVPVDEPVSKAAIPSPALAPATGGWWPMTWIREAFSGAWQRNIATPVADVMTFGAVFSCITLIATDIAKMHLGLVEEQSDGTAKRVKNPAYSPVLKKPNHYQNRIMFIMQWVISKLTWGNTYVLLERNNRGGEGAGNVTAMYVLDPSRVQVLVAPNGDVYYALSADVLAGIEAGVPAIPASEIIHDVMYPLYHPLVGVSPIHACGLAAIQGLRIQTNSAKFFANGAALGGVLTAPGAISNETAARLKEFWESKYAGPENVGKVAVLGDGLKFEAMTMRSTDAQLIEQLKWTAENVCTCYHMPPHKIGIGPPPAANNIEALDQQYYSQCLQILIECIEALLDQGQGVKEPLRTQFDLDDLLRMDSATLIDIQAKGVGAGLVSPNEGRRKLGLPPVAGGQTPYLQQQNYSLAALDRRDQAEAAPASVSAGQVPKPPPASELPTEEPDAAVDGVIEEALFLLELKSMVEAPEFLSDAA